MILSIKPKTIELFPGTVAVNRLDVFTTSFQKDVTGVRISYSIQRVELIEVVSQVLGTATTTDESGVETVTQELVSVPVQQERVTYSDSRFVLLTPEQWANWAEGDNNSDDKYIASCVAKNIGVELA